MKKLNICLVGFGNVGREFCRLLNKKHDELLKSLSYDIRVTAIGTKTRGNLLNLDGINTEDAIYDVEKLGEFKENPNYVSMPIEDLVLQSRADVLIELSTLSIKDGEPASSYIKLALNNGVHVITGNKGPIAWNYKGLKDLADGKGLKFFYETVVMDGTPVFNMVKYSLPGCKVTGIKGILNSTTNFILGEMEKGNSYESAVREAQRRGFAEKNPSLDVDGWDAAAKVAALANVLMDANINPYVVERSGIGNINVEQIRDALARGNKVKLICEAYLENSKIKTKVYPKDFPLGHIYSTIDATSSVITIVTDLMGEISVIEKNPEILQTAYGIYSDMLNLIKEIN